MEDVISLSKVLEWGGVSFGKNDWFKIRLALKVHIINLRSLWLSLTLKKFASGVKYML
jgi:hypothetical protein